MKKGAIIAGTNSGCGKTTITIAILMALKKRGLNPASFKCGPDYIDPMFHRKALNVAAYNLDSFFCDKNMINSIYHNKTENMDIAIVEGVMGYYDGVSEDLKGSTYEIASYLGLPVILVVNAKGMSFSCAALIKGFMEYRDNSNIKGVIFNNITETAYLRLKTIVEKIGVKSLGYLPHEEEIFLESRNLGLVVADEVSNINERLKKILELAEKTIDIDALIQLTEQYENKEIDKNVNNKLYDCDSEHKQSIVRIAVAKDEAFCFIYQENLELLEHYGCEICYFSPLHDIKLPQNIQGIYLPGGYPELHLEKLSNNKEMLAKIKSAYENKIPIIAECGGFMYLHDEIDGYEMASVISGKVFKTDKLKRFGYATLTAKNDNILCNKNESFRVHEYHYYDSTENGNDFIAEKNYKDIKYECGHANNTLYAGFPHIYFLSNPKLIKNMVDRMREKL